jgi:hypothetical protein
MDGGQLLQWTLFTTLSYWLMAALIISRRSLLPTKWDLILISSGFVVILPVTIFLTLLIWSWRGLHCSLLISTQTNVTTTTAQIRTNETNAGNGSYGICRVIKASRSPSPDPKRSAATSSSVATGHD